MRVLVTGAAGFIGSHVARVLVERGLDVVGVDRPGASPQRLATFAARVRLEEADLAEPEVAAGLMSQHRPELLVHLAWYARPEDYLTSRENLRSLSTTTALVAAAVDGGCRRIVCVGTCLEYAASDAPHRETDPVGPDTLYAGCKHAARVVGERLAAGRASFTWARVFHLHGPGEDPGRLLPMVAGNLRRGEPVDLSAGDQVRDYLRVEDVADAIVTVALSDAGGSVNVCSGTPRTLREILGALGDELGKPELLRFGRVPFRTDERMRIVGEPATLRRLGWVPHHASLKDALRYFTEPFQ